VTTSWEPEASRSCADRTRGEPQAAPTRTRATGRLAPTQPLRHFVSRRSPRRRPTAAPAGTSMSLPRGWLMQNRPARAHAFEAAGSPAGGGRVPPHDLDAEAAVLSAILLEQGGLDKVLETLKPEHFYAEANRDYEAAIELSAKGTPVDIVKRGGHAA